MKRARSFLVRDELKYRDLVSARFDFVSQAFPGGGEDLGKLLVREASTATIFLVHSESYFRRAFRKKLNDGAEFATDFDLGDIVKETARRMIEEVPLFKIRPYQFEEFLGPSLKRGHRLAGTLRFDLDVGPGFDAPRVLSEIGGKLRDAEVFAARAYSLLDVDGQSDRYGGIHEKPYFESLSLRRGLLNRALAVPRIFDKDHAASVKVLNERVNLLQGFRLELNHEQLVREEDSRAVDALQAADIAAGFAREILDRRGLRALGAQFRRVVLNGTDLARLKDFN